MDPNHEKHLTDTWNQSQTVGKTTLTAHGHKLEFTHFWGLAELQHCVGTRATADITLWSSSSSQHSPAAFLSAGKGKQRPCPCGGLPHTAAISSEHAEPEI